MKFKLSPETLTQGRTTQMGLSEKAQNDTQRMAGDKIASFADQMKSGSAAGAQEWNKRFSMSNEGAAFNMAKMNGGQIPGTDQEGAA